MPRRRESNRRQTVQSPSSRIRCRTLNVGAAGEYVDSKQSRLYAYPEELTVMATRLTEHGGSGEKTSHQKDETFGGKIMKKRPRNDSTMIQSETVNQDASTDTNIGTESVQKLRKHVLYKTARTGRHSGARVVYKVIVYNFDCLATHTHT